MVHDYETMRICTTAYLRYVRQADEELTAITERIARIEARLEGLGAASESAGQSGGAGHDQLPDGLAALEELRDALETEVVLHAGDICDAERLCRPSAESRHALWLHEVERLTWDGVGRRIGYSARQAQRMASAGTIELYRLMPERWRREPIPNAAPK